MSTTNVIELCGASIYHFDAASIAEWGKFPKGGDLVLSDVNFKVSPGELVYLIGRVGSGKSTLLKTIYAEIQLWGGSGRVAEYDLRSIRRRDIPYLRRQLGVVFQDYQLLTDRSAYNNIYYVMQATGWRDRVEMHRRIEEIIATVGLTGKEYKMPFELSGGEQQRLSIARALINRPKVILADEPTGNLDPQANYEIMDLFKSIVEDGCSIVMATHNIANIQHYPARTYRFSQGRVEEIDIHQILGLE